MEDKGCLLQIVAVIGWFIFCGICLSSDANPIVVVLIIAVVTFIILFLYIYLKDYYEEKLYEKVINIKNKYPRAYQKFRQEQGIYENDSNLSIEALKKIATRDFSLWETEENELKKAAEKNREENVKKSKKWHEDAERIKESYPDGFSKWEKLQKGKKIYVRDYEISEAEEEIKNLDLSAKNEKWLKDQSEFTQKCRDVGPQIMNSFGYYKYYIPIESQSNSKVVEREYLVWQFFADSFCLDNDLDYTYFNSIKQNTQSIDEFKQTKRHFNQSVYVAIRNFINKLAEDYRLSVYLCGNNIGWTTGSLNYHYCQVAGSQFHNFQESIEVCDYATDALLSDKSLNYEEYPKFENRHIVVIEMQTDNEHLKEVCKKIIENNKDKKPLITYISFLKGYDRDEMLKLIKEKAEEESLKLKKQEIEHSIQELPSIVESNDIEKIESKIEYIEENINCVSEDEKKDFDSIKIDYDNKKALGIPQKEELLFVNYNIPQVKTEKGYYAIVRMPQKGCIVWPYRRRTIARRGYTESFFEKKLEKYFENKIQVLGDVNILPQNGVRPYEPDIALIYSENKLNIRIDIEIDEPYAAITNKPTHYIGCGDDNRDANLNCLGWIVIRFSEQQVFQQSVECVKFIADIIKSIDDTFNIPELTNIPTLISEKQWTKIECQRMAKECFRQEYLCHNFGRTEEAVYNVKDLELTSFETSILDKVKHSITTIPESKTTIIEEDFSNENNILYNKANEFEQDKHIEFDSSLHLYTIDGIQYRSVSSVVSDLFPEFDTEYWSNRKAIERGIEVKQIAEEWESKGLESREVGTFLHQQIENHFLNKPINYKYHYIYQGFYIQEDRIVDIYYEFDFFRKFLKETTINPFRTEWRIFDRTLKLAGTIDLISKNEDDSYTIYDWKRSSRLFNNNQYQHGIGRLYHLEDTPRNHYFLQQNLYRYILEHQYGIKIKSMKLVGLHPDYCNYELIDVPIMDKEVSEIIKML